MQTYAYMHASPKTVLSVHTMDVLSFTGPALLLSSSSRALDNSLRVTWCVGPVLVESVSGRSRILQRGANVHAHMKALLPPAPIPSPTLTHMKCCKSEDGTRSVLTTEMQNATPRSLFQIKSGPGLLGTMLDPPLRVVYNLYHDRVQ